MGDCYQTMKASLIEREGVRFGISPSGTGVGASWTYLPTDGMSEDKKKWMSAGSWGKPKRYLSNNDSTPGPGSYVLGSTIGEHQMLTVASAGRTAFGKEVRFSPLHNSDNRRTPHAYCQVEYSSPAVSPTSGTFSSGNRSGHQIIKNPTPGPKYQILEKFNERSATFLGTPRFPPDLERSPGPIYGVQGSDFGRGPRLPPKAELQENPIKFLETTISRVSKLLGKKKESIDKCLTETIIEKEKRYIPTRDIRSKLQRASFEEEDEALISTQTGALLAKGGFGRKTARDMAMFCDSTAPGPLDYDVQDTMIRRKHPVTSFGPKTGTGSGGLYDLPSQADSRKKIGNRDLTNTENSQERRSSELQSATATEQLDVNDSEGGSPMNAAGKVTQADQCADNKKEYCLMPGPGAYLVGAASGGPSFSIAAPLKRIVKQSPGPSSYCPEGYSKKRKPSSSTFSRSTRFGAAADVRNSPGPGYYQTPKHASGLKFVHGSSRACPDVIGWMARKRETETKRREHFQAMHRRMVITGSDDFLDTTVPNTDPTALERPVGKFRKIWY